MGDRKLRKRKGDKSASDNTGTMNYEAKVNGELSGLTFQIGEALEELTDVNELSIEEIRSSMDELKLLRVNMVKVSCELKNLQVDNADKSVEPSKVDSEVEQLLKDSKKMLSTLQSAIRSKERKDSLIVAEKERVKAAELESQQQARRYAYDAIIVEITALVKTLTANYDTKYDADVMSREVVLERKEMKSSFASELLRLKSLSDRVLNYTDVQFENKDKWLNSLLNKILKIGESKEVFERKLLKDIENLDLSDQMLQLATNSKLNIGKFDGSLDKGLDYYSFKTRFLKRYANHPKALVVELLVTNHLDGRAKDCIGSLDNLDEIWIRLKENFGNVDQLLTHHITKITKLGPMHKIKALEQKMLYVQQLVNIMSDTYELAREHHLTNDLHYGSYLIKIVTMLEKPLQSRWYKILAEEDVVKEARWMKMHGFLKEELKVLQIRVSETPAAEMMEGHDDAKDKKLSEKGKSISSERSFVALEVCRLCNNKHPSPNSDFYHCKKFLQMSPKERSKLVMSKQCCLQCLDTKTKWRDPQHQCSDKWVCKNAFHNTFDKKLHFLCCDKHVDDEENKVLYEQFKTEVLNSDWQKNLHSSIYLSVPPHASNAAKTFLEHAGIEDDDDAPAYLLQPVPFNGHVFSMMFDTGCGNFVCRSAAIDALPQENKINTRAGPIVISGVGNQQVTSSHGEYKVTMCRP